MPDNTPWPVARTGIALSADVVMFVTLLVEAVAALAIGEHFGSLWLAEWGSATLLGLGAAAFAWGRGTTAGRLVLTLCNVALVVLHIQLGRGTLEFHFGIFVLLGLLLVYQDWRPIALAAALFAVHHMVFDRLQAQGVGVYCTPQANFMNTLLHAAYVVAQTSIEIVLALRLQRAVVESQELEAMIRSTDQGAVLCLDVSALPATSESAQQLKLALARMAQAMGDVRGAASAIEGACGDIAAGSMDLSRRTEQQASSLQQTAASMEQLTVTVKNTAVAAAQATQLASAASGSAAQGGTAVSTVMASMAAISQSSRRIADINAVIDGIAFQTNILALNAAVESARAGEQGRGFAVVAAEVRQLAQRSATAAREIKHLVTDAVEKIEHGTLQVASAGASMEAIVTQSESVSRLVHDISDTASQQNTGISQVGQAVTQLDAATQQNAAMVEQSAAATASLQQQAVQLMTVVNRFRLQAAPGANANALLIGS